MKPRHFTTLHTDLDPHECRRRLSESTDPERQILFSPSGYEASKVVLDWIDTNRFRLRKRIWWRNDFSPQFHAKLVPEERGTTIEGFFDVPALTKIVSRICLGGAVLFGVPTFILTIRDILAGRANSRESILVGLLVPPATILLGILIPKFGLWLGSGEERYILALLHKVFDPRIPKPS